MLKNTNKPKNFKNKYNKIKKTLRIITKKYKNSITSLDK
ncbi:hypothetical protein CNEO_260049 [Clostridium neonatale]|nr:hypothetical protein CNEO_260049 [Clostridium neonatale]